MSRRPSTKKPAIPPLLLRIIAHPAFFWLVVALFVLQALWIALSALYPMLFDEEFHVGVIEIYSRELSPFITHQPPEAAFHGDITRMGSYLFHYLMSFPYRLVSVFTDSLAAHIIVLRVLCVVIAAAGLVMFNKVLRLAKVPPTVRHVVALFFILVPIVPFAAAQVNYDSLVFLLVPTLFYAALKSLQKTNRQVLWIIVMLAIGAFASLVKFSVLPIFLGVAIFVAVILWRQYHKKTALRLWHQLQRAPRWLAALVIAIALLAAGLFIERYGTNLVVYHQLDPSCSRIHPKQVCSHYNVAQRTYQWSEDYQKHPHPLMNPALYTVGYFIPHIFNDFFVTGAYTGGHVVLREPLGKLEASGGNIFLRAVGWLIFVAGSLLVIFTWRQTKYQRLRYLFLLAGGIYIIALWVKIYGSYQQLGTPVAAQGRYMIPLLIPALTMVVIALNQVIRRTTIKLAFCVVALLAFTQGGGAMTYILYSKPNWYWPNQTVVKVNQSARKVLKSLTF